ncbi:gamma-glutamylcyclotransferase-like isoform X1 [Brienomyrus brachyistius]|uniref:gamma-glutamylcyclotransferase-like isoform X1 n=1 Tax=Brienomyrus brachyistius TaxID=42636 RepID=UPI0020B1E9A2|nr:gamma-glutamylcyclotransferase-like isoform X1 [Brienomyrus brachyistius]
MQNVDDPERCFSSLPASNLLKERLQLKNPSAVFHCLGRLKRYPSATLLYHTQVGFKPITQEDYCLTFGFTEEQFDNRWHGGVATIEESRGTDVWGVIWKMSKDNLDSLDKQEAVDTGMYSPLEVMVETDMGEILCRTYRMNRFRTSPPSPQYKEVVCLGAQQNGLPPDYIKRLEAMQTNNYAGPSILDEIKKAMK